MVSFFIISVGITGFASLLPEIMEIVGNQPKYNGSYKVGYEYNAKTQHDNTMNGR